MNKKKYIVPEAFIMADYTLDVLGSSEPWTLGTDNGLDDKPIFYGEGV